MRKRHLTCRGIAAVVSIGLLGYVLVMPLSPAAGAAPSGNAKVVLNVVSAYSSPAKAPFRDFAVTEGQAVADFHWLINSDNVGDPTFDAANCLPTSAQDQITPDAGTGSFPASCTWPSIRAIDGHSPILASGDAVDLPSGGLTLPNGDYLISVTADGFKIDGAHVTVSGADQTITVQMNPLPLPSVTVRVNVFNDNASTNGQFDGVSESTTDMSGFAAHLNDIGGEVEFDVYGNALCTEYQTDAGAMTFDGDGSPIPVVLANGGSTGGHLAGAASNCISDSSGEIVIPNLGPNRYAITVSPPDPQTTGELPWIQTTTLEGGHDWDAWVMEGSSGYDTELVVGGEAVPFVHFGFVRRVNRLNQTAPGSINGRMMVGRSYVAQTNGLPNPGTIWGGGTGTVLERPVEDGWVSLACLSGCSGPTDEALYVQPANSDGTFNITQVSAGTYSLTMWDEAQERLLDTVQVTVANTAVDVGVFPLAGWFTDLEGSIFIDRNGNGRRDGVGTAYEEPGVPDFGLTLRTRVNTLQDQGAANSVTGPDGEWAMAAYPLGQFLILEAYHSGYKTTGLTYKLGNETTSHTQLTDQVDWNVLNIFGLGGHVDIGVQAYGPGENGGIVGTVSYDVTRNELNPRNAATEDWQPGVPDMTMQLWRPRAIAGVVQTVPSGPFAGAAIQVCADGADRPLGDYGKVDAPGGCDPLQDPQSTEHWSRPEGCVARTADGTPAYSQALPVPANDSACIEAPMMGVQVGDHGEVDGNYGFGDLTIGDYLVEAISPTNATVAGLNPSLDQAPIYKFTDEAAINVFKGDTYVPQLYTHDGSAASEPSPLPQVDYAENTSESACAGRLHLITVTDQDFLDNGGSPADGLMRPYCDVKLIRVQPRRSIAPIFHVYTEVPIPTRFVGYIIDDLSVSTNPKSTVFGEKAGMSNVPVGMYDFTGRLVYTAESDYNGYYEALLPSTDTIACPTPSGVCPNVYRLVGNDPGQLLHPNANYNPQYRTIGTEFQGWPGVIHPVDQAPTRVAASFQLPGSQLTSPPLCAVPSGQPEFYRIDKPFGVPGSGPYTISGTSFGATAGKLVLGGYTISTSTWTNTSLTFTLPTNAPTGPATLRVIGSNGQQATNGVTFHTIGGSYNPRIFQVGTGLTGPRTFDPATDPADGSGPRAIQKAVDAARGANGNALVVIYPNLAPAYENFNPDRAYFENVVIHSRLKLQGVGPGGPGTPGARIDGRYFWSENAAGNATYADWWMTATTALPVAGNATVSSGQVIYVRPESKNQFNGAGFTAAIDGLTITGGDQQGFPTNLNFLGGGTNGQPRPGANNVEAQGGGVFLNAYATNTQISNNVFSSNGGTFGGAIRVGTPELGSTDATSTSRNTGVKILRNRIVANGGTMFAGAIGMFYGSDSYEIAFNDICGNASAEYGGGISHYGRSPGGRIHHNRVIDNQSYDEGGGIMIAGELPANTSALSTGSGAVTIDHNIIEANLSNDDGGGVRFLMGAGNNNDKMEVSNNIIANNVATHEGAGIAIDDTPNVRIVSNTIARNVTTATAMTSNGLPAPAGVATGANSSLLQTRLNRIYGDRNAPQFSNPVLLDNIFADNRAGTWTGQGIVGIGLPGDGSPPLRWDVGATDGSGRPTVYGSLVDSAASSAAYRTGSGFQLGAGSSDIQIGAGSGISNVGFVRDYQTQVSVANWRTFPNFRPTAIVTVDLPISLLADYHINTTRPPSNVTAERVVNKGLATTTAAQSAPYGAIAAPLTDIDDSVRPTPAGSNNFDIGADEIAPLPADPPLLNPPLPVPIVPLLDSFDRANSFNLGSAWVYQAPWFNSPSFGVDTNVTRPLLNGFALWNSTSFAGNQQAGVTVVAPPPAGRFVSLVLDANGSAGFFSTVPRRYIEVRFSATSVEVRQTTGGSYNPAIIGSSIATTALVAGDVIDAKVSNGVVEVFKNGVSLGTRALPGNWTTAFKSAGGRIGLRHNNVVGSLRLDDFRGGNL